MGGGVEKFTVCKHPREEWDTFVRTPMVFRPPSRARPRAPIRPRTQASKRQISRTYLYAVGPAPVYLPSCPVVGLRRALSLAIRSSAETANRRFLGNTQPARPGTQSVFSRRQYPPFSSRCGHDQELMVKAFCIKTNEQGRHRIGSQYATCRLPVLLAVFAPDHPA